jgi:hypothetical protein
MSEKFTVKLPEWYLNRFMYGDNRWCSITGIFPKAGNECLEALLPSGSITEDKLYADFNLKDTPIYYR